MNKIWHLRRRRPVQYAPVEPRNMIVQSLKTDSRAEAERKAMIIWSHLIEGWEALLDSRTDDAERRFSAARRLAKRQGFRFMPVDEVAKLPIDELSARMDATLDRDGAPDPAKAAAFLGGATEPPITVSNALELY
ncbi:MAG: DUF6538 domain-containing protein, partial [Pseudomonadota bacterium]